MPYAFNSEKKIEMCLKDLTLSTKIKILSTHPSIVCEIKTIVNLTPQSSTFFEGCK